MTTKTGFLCGKKLLITGVLSNRSIAYGIAKACHDQGAELAFSYVGERFKERVVEYAGHFGSQLVYECDVADTSVSDTSSIEKGIIGITERSIKRRPN